MWNDRSYKIMDIFDNVENIVFPAECPVCQKRTGHIFFYRYRDSYGGTWVWCSNCRNSSHTSGTVPDWWINPDFVDVGKLTALPDYPEKNKTLIDEWINRLKGDLL